MRNGRANSADIFRAFCPAKGTSRVRSSALDFSLSGHEDDAEPAFCLPAGWRTDPGCNSESRFDKAHKQKEGSRKAIPRGSLFYRNREALVFTHPGSPLCMPTSVRYDYLKKVNMESKCLSEKLLLHFCPMWNPGAKIGPGLWGLWGQRRQASKSFQGFQLLFGLVSSCSGQTCFNLAWVARRARVAHDCKSTGGRSWFAAFFC